jgi:hypothetical protein
VRRVSLDVRPDATTTPQQLNAFLASCQAGGVTGMTVSIWAGMDQCFLDPRSYFAIVQDYIAAIRRNGYAHAFVISNASVTRDNALAAWWPGDSLVDAVMPTFTCSGPAPGSGGDTLAVAAGFAAQRGLPFGLAGFGADASQVTVAQGTAFLEYVLGYAVPLAGADCLRHRLVRPRGHPAGLEGTAGRDRCRAAGKMREEPCEPTTGQRSRMAPGRWSPGRRSPSTRTAPPP